MAETVAPTPDRMFVEIRYKPLYMETYMVKQIISPPIKLFNLAEIFICKQRNNKILTWYSHILTNIHCKKTHRFYGEIPGIWLPVHLLLFLLLELVEHV